MKTDKTKLEKLYLKYNKKNLISPDPLQFLYDYKELKDREIAALIAGCFAYGNVKQIIKTVNLILGKMGSPYDFLAAHTKAEMQKIFKGFKYRFTTQEQLVNFLNAMREIIKEYGSLEAAFLEGYDPADKDVVPALSHFARLLRSYGEIGTLVPDPDKKSALKRLNLFLRWMVRCDEVDPGGWTHIHTSKLIVPLDVHMHRLSRQLGLTKRNQADMKTAQEISMSFAKFCVEDPIKYDFCITRFGIRDDMDSDELK
ncbi:TIGR02757 family protein [Elusimicrobium posterum]|uniref:TIGR02757 family protein n=1 Tax=Elusimicrobium posterum TaxID=3116653 RepID=UPI003C737FC2